MIYWSSTKAPVHLFKREYETPELAKHVTENACVDASILAAGLRVEHLNPQAVAAYQRRLGVRKIAENNPLHKRRHKPIGMTSACTSIGGSGQ